MSWSDENVVYSPAGRLLIHKSTCCMEHLNTVAQERLLHYVNSRKFSWNLYVEIEVLKTVKVDEVCISV
jgi:hypothetical protein